MCEITGASRAELIEASLPMQLYRRLLDRIRHMTGCLIRCLDSHVRT